MESEVRLSGAVNTSASFVMPSELGTVQDYFRSKNPSAPFILQIQDAHANPSAQKNIARILDWFNTQHGEQKNGRDWIIALEGVKGTIHPEYLDFFKGNRDVNEELVNSLAAKGELTGAEIFGWKLYGKNKNLAQFRPQDLFAGAEEPLLYKENLKIYRDFLDQENRIHPELEALRKELEKLENNTLSREAREFLREKRHRKEGNYGSGNTAPQWTAYIGYLKLKLKERLKLDLDAPFEQVRFPNVVRLSVLSRADQVLQPEKVTAEKSAFLSELKKRVSSQENEWLRLFETRPAGVNLRETAEQVWALAQTHQMRTEDFKSFWLSTGRDVLSAEIDFSGLDREMTQLERWLGETMAVSAEERRVLQTGRDLDLLDKLLSLEINREKLEAFEADQNEILPRIFSLKKNPQIGAALTPFIRQAQRFYTLAGQRDTSLLEKTLEAAKGKTTAVLITGGYHTQGLSAKMRERGIGYAVIQPKMEDSDGGMLYRKALREENADVSAYFDKPYLTKQEALFFKTITETGASALWEQAHVPHAEIAGKVAGAINQHPVLAQRFEARSEAIAENGSRLDFEFHQKPREEKPRHSGVQAVVITPVTSDAVSFGQLYPEHVIPADQTLTGQTTYLPAGLSVGIHFNTAAFSKPRSGTVSARSEVRMPTDGEPAKSGREKLREARIRAGQNEDESWNAFENLITEKNTAVSAEQGMLIDVQKAHDFFGQFLSSIPDKYKGDAANGPLALANQGLRLYLALLKYQEHREDIVEALPRSDQPRFEGFSQSRSELLVVTKDRPSLMADITSVMPTALNIERDFSVTLDSDTGLQKTVILVYELSRDGTMPPETNLRGVTEEVLRILKAVSALSKEISLTGRGSNAQGVFSGNAAILQGVEYGVSDVVYDIYAGINASDLTLEQKAREKVRRVREDANRFQMVIEERILPIIEDLPETLGIQPDVIPVALRFVKTIEQKVLEEEDAYRRGGVFSGYRRSALSRFLKLVALEGAKSQLQKNIIEQIDKIVLQALKERFFIYDPSQVSDEDSQSQLIESQITRLNLASEKVLAPLQQHATGPLRGVIESIRILLIPQIQEEIRGKSLVAEEAITNTALKIIRKLQQSKWEKERINAVDYQKIFSHMILVLRGSSNELQGKVLKAEDTSDMILLARKVNIFDLSNRLEEFQGLVRMIVSDDPEATLGSHWVQMADGDFGVPTMLLPPGALGAVLSGDMVGEPVLIHGAEGKVFLRPSAATRERLTEETAVFKAIEKVALESANEPAVTRNGVPIAIRASAERTESIRDAMAQKASGVGLGRTEFLIDVNAPEFVAWLNNANSESRRDLIRYFKVRFRDILQSVAESNRSEPVTLRTYDNERDKDLGLPNPDQQFGPAYYATEIGRELLKIELLGMLEAGLDYSAALRILFPTFRNPIDLKKFLKRGDLGVNAEEQSRLDAQARGDIDLMLEVLGEARNEIETSQPAAREKLAALKTGFMIETQEGVHILDYIFSRADYISLGTTDLTISEYRLLDNMSRDNPERAHYFSEIKPEFLQTVRRILKSASLWNESHDAKVNVEFCGVLADLDAFLLALVQAKPANVNIAISRSPRKIAVTKLLVRTIQAGVETQEQATAELSSLRTQLRQLPQVEAALKQAVTEKAEAAQTSNERSGDSQETIDLGPVSTQTSGPAVPQVEGTVTAERSYTVASPAGLHMTPVMTLVKTLMKHKDVTGFIVINGAEFDLKDSFAMLTMAAEVGTALQIRLTGPAEKLTDLFNVIEKMTDDTLAKPDVNGGVGPLLFNPGTAARSEVRTSQEPVAAQVLEDILKTPASVSASKENKGLQTVYHLRYEGMSYDFVLQKESLTIWALTASGNREVADIHSEDPRYAIFHDRLEAAASRRSEVRVNEANLKLSMVHLLELTQRALPAAKAPEGMEAAEFAQRRTLAQGLIEKALAKKDFTVMDLSRAIYGARQLLGSDLFKEAGELAELVSDWAPEGAASGNSERMTATFEMIGDLGWGVMSQGGVTAQEWIRRIVSNLFRDYDETTLKMIAFALSQIPGGFAGAEMAAGNQRQTASDGIQAAIANLSNQNRNVRSDAAFTLGTSTTRNDLSAVSAIPALISRLTDQDADVVFAILYTLREMGPRAVSAVPAIISKLADSHMPLGTRWVGYDALSSVGLGAVSALPELMIAFLNTPNDDDRETISSAIFTLSLNQEDAVILQLQTARSKADNPAIQQEMDALIERINASRSEVRFAVKADQSPRGLQALFEQNRATTAAVKAGLDFANQYKLGGAGLSEPMKSMANQTDKIYAPVERIAAQLDIPMLEAYGRVIRAVLGSAGTEESAKLAQVREIISRNLGEAAKAMAGAADANYQYLDIAESAELNEDMAYGLAVLTLARPQGDRIRIYVTGDAQSAKTQIQKTQKVYSDLLAKLGAADRANLDLINAAGWNDSRLKKDMMPFTAGKTAKMDAAVLSARSDFLNTMAAMSKTWRLNRAQINHAQAMVLSPALLAQEIGEHTYAVLQMKDELDRLGLSNQFAAHFAQMIAEIKALSSAA